MMNESPDPVAQKWFNTDAGRTIIAAAIVGAFMIVTAAAVLIGGANQTQQSGQTAGSQTATPTNPPPAPPTPPFSERPDPSPDHGGTASPGFPERSDPDLRPDLRADLHAELGGARAEFRCADRVELGGAVDLLVQLCTDAWRCGQHYDADNAGIASHPGPHLVVAGTAAVDGTARGPTDPRVDTGRDATVRVTGLGETLDRVTSLTSHERADKPSLQGNVPGRPTPPKA